MKLSLLMLGIVGTGVASANLISVGPVASPGSGMGAVHTALVFSGQGQAATASGCVGAGVGGGRTLASAACPGGFAGGGENNGANTRTYTAADLGLTDFKDLQVVFNPAEPGNDQTITLTKLALTLWNPEDGSLIFSYETTAPQTLTALNSSSAFAFELDAAQVAQANEQLSQFPNLRLGIAAAASDANGSPEAVYFQLSQVPEPTSILLGGAGLLGLGLLRRRSKA